MKKLNKSEAINQILKIDKIQWKFSLSRVPWWGGKFEQVVGPVKNPLYKTVGKVFLSWRELEEVLFGIQDVLNSRPLNYIEADIKFPILTPNVRV